ncbi:MAG: gliding motility-associated C-terminal domain-containing protein [Bacteroidetes bacterium]|nr:gliding motility-associated C-terminal domain-containing protein [Bacteroidota bacterium]
MKPILLIVLFLCCQHAKTQTCTGGLGDPIVNIDFGAGPNFGPPLAAGITNLQYTSNQCPNDGQYTIASSTNNCFGNSWLNINKDHTGKPNGYFMLINASYQPSDFYVQTVNGLCEGTTYQFAAYVMNVAAVTGQILPNITFTIEKTDGTVLSSVNSGNIVQSSFAKWNQYGFFFTTPTGISSVVLRMTNNAPGGVGNDLAIDDITFKPAGPSINVTTINYNSDTIRVCPGNTNPFQFSAVVGSCYINPTYQWQLSTDSAKTWTDIPGANTTSYTALPTAIGTYSYRLTTAQSGNIGLPFCRVASSPITIFILRIPIPSISISNPEVAVCVDSVTTFTAHAIDSGSSPIYQWMVNGNPVSAMGAIFTTNSLSNNDIVSCAMTSNAQCVLNPVALSNTISMTVKPSVISSVQIAGSSTAICSDTTAFFSASISNGGDNPSYKWMKNGQAVGSDSTMYYPVKLNDGDQISLIMKSSLGCTIPASSNIISMTVYPSPYISLPADTTIAPRSSIQLNPSITGQIDHYTWSPSIGLDNPNVPNPWASPLTNTSYALNVTTNEGCTATATETVFVYFGLSMPNAFTPNGDGINDLLRIPASTPIHITRFSVYNRWGSLVFTTSSVSNAWDGSMGNKPVPAGTYVWMIQYIDPLTKNQTMAKGTVELIR